MNKTTVLAVAAAITSAFVAYYYRNRYNELIAHLDL